MKQFDVLSAQTQIAQSYLIEASAGTGKTFSIENILVRLLLEENHGKKTLAIEDIAVMTFTRDATRELRSRVRKNIEKVHQALVRYDSDGLFDETTYDYVKAVCQLGKEAVRKAKRRLARALADYDDAQIYTIHGFCYRALLEYSFESDIYEGAFNEEQAVSPSRILRAIKDYFRTEVLGVKYCSFQLEVLLNKHQHDLDLLARSLMHAAMRGLQIKGGPSFTTSFYAFKRCIQGLKQKYSWTEEALLADFDLIAPHYKKVFAKSEVKRNRSAFSRMAKCFSAHELDIQNFEKILKDQFRPFQYFHQGNLKKNAKLPKREQLHCPGAIDLFKDSLDEIIREASSYLWIYGRMAEEIRQFIRKIFQEEEAFTPDDILSCMLKALEKKTFVDALRQRYHAVIVDEFQDTDPVQWKIISQLFLSQEEAWGCLYLVGDPKQSIYGFRRADIYTYMQASRELGKGAQVTLSTNFRSQKKLIKGLNVLLDQERIPEFIRLPRTEEKIPCAPLQIPDTAEEKNFLDEGAAIQFFVAKGSIGRGKTWPSESLLEEQLFPFITQEIQKLYQQNHLKWSQFAVLVRDRFEAEKLQKFFKKWSVPSTTKRSAALVDSPIFVAFFDVIKAVIHPFSHGDVAKALAGIIIAWGEKKVQEFTEGECADEVLQKLETLRHKLFEDGVIAFFQEFLRTAWYDSGKSFFQDCMSRENGLKIFLVMEQISELIAEEECRVPSSSEGILGHFERIQKMHENDDPRVKLRQSREDAVNILTLHISKGLEFDIVFCLGLAKRSPEREHLIPAFKEGKDFLLACKWNDDAAVAYVKELDAEKMRQFYVGVTRAKYRLYLPIVLEKEERPIHLGCASPMELYLEKLKLKNIGELSELSENLSVRWISENMGPLDFVDEAKECIQISGEKKIEIPGTSMGICSFSSLFKHLSHGFSGRIPPKDWEAELKTPFTIPAGADTGVMLHTLFETFPYDQIEGLTSPSDIEPLIQNHLKTFTLSWIGAFSEILYHTFFTQLKSKNLKFCLSDVNPEYMWHEMEFLYPMDEGISFDKGGDFLKGFIDLIFMHEGCYYIIDWKSNWLGDHYEMYQGKQLDDAMQEHCYYRQSEIYTSALERYLKLVDPRPFVECFGGVFYLFVRGMNVDLAVDTGVYYIAPSWAKKKGEK